MNDMHTLDLATLLPLRDDVSRLSSDRWNVHDVGGLIRLTGKLDVSPLQWTGLPNLDKYAVRRQARGTRRSYDIVVDTINGVWEITELPDILPSQLFDPDELNYADKVWERESAALLGLTLDWSVEIDLDLSAAIAAPANVQVDVNWQAQYVEKLFGDEPLGSLSRLLPKEGRRVFLALEGSEAPAVFGGVTLATLDGLATPSLPIGPPNLLLPGETLVGHLPSPAQTLAISGEVEQWPLARRALDFASCAAIWVEVASSWDGAVLEFFGYKKVRFSLPNAWTREEIAGAARLRKWAFGDISPDRLLALRQIISLYNEPPFAFVEEILSSSETIYLGLRSEAVIEAVRDARGVESRAQLAIQQSSQSSVDLAKSAGERVIAGLVAVGTAATANITQVLSAPVTTTILAFIDGYFLVTLMLFMLIDFRAVGLPIKELDSETLLHSSFMRADAIRRISTSPIVLGAKRLVLTVRVSISALYVLILLSLTITILVRW